MFLALLEMKTVAVDFFFCFCDLIKTPQSYRCYSARRQTCNRTYV